MKERIVRKFAFACMAHMHMMLKPIKKKIYIYICIRMNVANNCYT